MSRLMKLKIMFVFLMVLALIAMIAVRFAHHRENGVVQAFKTVSAPAAQMSVQSKKVKHDTLAPQLVSVHLQLQGMHHQFDSLQQTLVELQQQLDGLPQHINTQASSQVLKPVMANMQHQLSSQLVLIQQSINQLLALSKQQLAAVPVLPEQVERYFHLVAVQGFSDGLRAVIDVAGHQLVLSPGQTCPACQGWRLSAMNYTQQQATFENPHQQHVVLSVR